MQNRSPGFAVVGCGSGAQAFAADVALKGFPVRIGTAPRFADRLAPIRDQGGIRLIDDAGERLARLEAVTADVGALVRGAGVVFVAAPAYRHRLLVEAIAPFLENGQYVLFVSHFAAMTVRQWMRQTGLGADVVPVESLTLPYSARLVGPAAVKIFARKAVVPVAALPASRTVGFIGAVSAALPQMAPAENVLFTSVNNAGPVLQTALALLNAGRIEDTAARGWNIVADGFTPSVARLVLRLDSEKASIARRLGIANVPLTGSLRHFGDVDGVTAEDFSKAMRANPVFANPEVPGPASLQDRFVSESVPFGLVPLASLADLCSVPAPAIKSLICLASIVNGRDYSADGITLEKMGMGKACPDELRTVLTI